MSNQLSTILIKLMGGERMSGGVWNELCSRCGGVCEYVESDGVYVEVWECESCSARLSVPIEIIRFTPEFLEEEEDGI